MKSILILAGPSAVGKTTVMKEILSRCPDFEFIRSATTRAPRGDGHDGEYIYLTAPEFKSRIENGEMLEYTEYSGNFYGTPSSEIERIFADGRIPLLILDINGVRSIKEKERGFKTVAVYITTDIATLEKRLYERAAALGGGEEALLSIKKRIEQNLRDISSADEFISLFDASVQNKVVTKTAEEIYRIFNNVK